MYIKENFMHYMNFGVRYITSRYKHAYFTRTRTNICCNNVICKRVAATVALNFFMLTYYSHINVTLNHCIFLATYEVLLTIKMYS